MSTFKKAEIAEIKQKKTFLNLENLDQESGLASGKPNTDKESDSESDQV